jgi:hypothetical protein
MIRIQFNEELFFDDFISWWLMGWSHDVVCYGDFVANLVRYRQFEWSSYPRLYQLLLASHTSLLALRDKPPWVAWRYW